MTINALAYLGIHSDKLEDWSAFATQLLGMQRVDQSRGVLSFRMDDRKQRLSVSNESGEVLAFMGWEVSSKNDLELYASRLEAKGHEVKLGNRSLAQLRSVEDLIVFNDPSGNRVELCWNPLDSSDKFVPGRRISGFKTGPLGMGHVVLEVNQIEVLKTFYCNLLDFQISDYGLTPYPMYFFHVNGRHHSFAMVGTGKTGFHHFMIEFLHLDDVGQGFDLAMLQENQIAYTIGRHTNDYMISYYANSPSGFFVENGWGGRIIDPEKWVTHETFDGPSFWGHERLYLPEVPRKHLRDMRLDAAANGKRAPQFSECPWLFSQFPKK